MIAGLMRSAASEQAVARIVDWIDTARYLREIAWYLRFAEQFDEVLLPRTCEIAIRHLTAGALLNALLAAASQFTSRPGTLIETVFLPAVQHLSAARDFCWVRFTWNSWLNSPLILVPR